MSIQARVRALLGIHRPLTCKHCGYRIHRDERLPRHERGPDMGRRGWVHWTTFHENTQPTDGAS